MARSAELTITSLISNKREWNNCFIRFLKLQKFEVRNTSEKSDKIYLMKMRNVLRDTLWSDRRRLITKNISCLFAYFLTSALHPNFPQKGFFSFGFIQKKISLSGENIFSLATLSAIIYHIRSN